MRAALEPAAPAPDAPASDLPTRRSVQAARRARARNRRVSVVGVIGELLITAGVVVLLFLGWQLGFNDAVVGQQLQTQARDQSEEWQEAAPALDPEIVEELIADPPVPTAPGNAQQFGALIVPRWGESYYRPISEGVGVYDVLNKGGLGHYPSTAMPGGVGNFAIAAHRTTKGGSLHNIHELRVGDHIYVETREGWYRYTFRNLEYVMPTGVGVIDPVPQTPEAAPAERFITLTSCNPILTSVERIIAYGVFDGFTPRDAAKPAGGAPSEIAAIVAAKKEA